MNKCKSRWNFQETKWWRISRSQILSNLVIFLWLLAESSPLRTTTSSTRLESLWFSVLALGSLFAPFRFAILEKPAKSNIIPFRFLTNCRQICRNKLQKCECRKIVLDFREIFYYYLLLANLAYYHHRVFVIGVSVFVHLLHTTMKLVQNISHVHMFRALYHHLSL